MTARNNLSKAAEKVTRADLKAGEALRPRRSSPPVKALSMISELGDQPQLRTLAAALLVAGLVSARPRLMRAGMRMLLAHELATAAKDFVKTRIDRARPRSSSSVEESRPAPGRDTSKEKTSFPSGHSGGAAAAALAYAREFPEHRSAALAAAGLVAGAQIPRSAHYASDVAAGLLLGAAAEAAGNLIWSAARTR